MRELRYQARFRDDDETGKTRVAGTCTTVIQASPAAANGKRRSVDMGSQSRCTSSSVRVCVCSIPNRYIGSILRKTAPCPTIKLEPSFDSGAKAQNWTALMSRVETFYRLL